MFVYLFIYLFINVIMARIIMNERESCILILVAGDWRWLNGSR